MAPKSWNLRLTLSGTVAKHLVCVVTISVTGVQTGALVLRHPILSKTNTHQSVSVS